MTDIETTPECPHKFPVVLSIDPSITVLGWALFDGAITSGTWKLATEKEIKAQKVEDETTPD